MGGDDNQSPTRLEKPLSSVTDLLRSQSQLIAENALLRQQLAFIHRQIKKPRFIPSDRLWPVLLASRVHHWKDTFRILKPDTLLCWHRQGFRLSWKLSPATLGASQAVN